MPGPLLEVAMSYVRYSCPHFDDEEGKTRIREAFDGFIYESTGRELVFELLTSFIGNTEPLERIETILSVPESCPVMRSAVFTPVSLQNLRKKTRPWTVDEDNRLLAGIHRFGLDDWSTISKFVGGGRSRAQCSQRWTRGLDPRISKDSWSPEDEAKLLTIIRESDRKCWTSISMSMGNRSDVQCRYHFLQMKREGRLPPEFLSMMISEKLMPPLPYQSKPPGMPRPVCPLPVPMRYDNRPRSNSLTACPFQYGEAVPFAGWQGLPRMQYSPPPNAVYIPMAPPAENIRLVKGRKSASQFTLRPNPIIPVAVHNDSDGDAFIDIGDFPEKKEEDNLIDWNAEDDFDGYSVW